MQTFLTTYSNNSLMKRIKGEIIILIFKSTDMLWVIVMTFKEHWLNYLFLVFNHVCGNNWTTEQGCLSPSSVRRIKPDHWKRELAPTSIAASLLLSVTSLLPGFMSNKFSSSSYCLSTCLYIEGVGKSA